jgi:endonuclease-3
MQDTDIHTVVGILEQEARKWGHPVVGNYSDTPFGVLVSCVLSLRTQDKTTHAASERLFSLARTPETMLALKTEAIQKAIYPVGFYKNKAKNIKAICRILLDEHHGRVPDDLAALLKLPGVGRKTANLVVTLGFGLPGICVDTHVHRIVNRWGYVQTRTPEQTELALRGKLPRRYWIRINDVLVAYGQNLCRPISPFCSRCRIQRFCDRTGVETSR